MSFFIQTAKSNNQFYTNTSVNDVIFRSSNSNQKIHIGTNVQIPAPLVVDDTSVSITGDIILTNSLALAGLSLYPSETTSNSSILSSSDAWILSMNSSNIVYTGPGFHVGIGNSNPLSKLHVSNGDIQINNGVYKIEETFISASGSNLGIGLSNPLETLHVNGNILSTGTFTYSDSRVKEKVTKIEAALDIVKSLNSYTFNYIDDPSSKLHSGYVAQEVEKVIPHIVSNTSIGMKTLSYTEVIPYITESIKEIVREIEDLKRKIERLNVE